MQDEKVSETITTGADVEAYLLNFFNHYCGDHDDCVGDKCRSPDYEQSCLCLECIQQVRDIGKSFHAKLESKTLAKLVNCRYTSEIESFNSFLLTYCPKLKKFHATHAARIWAAILDWNYSHGVEWLKDWRQQLLQQYDVLRF